MNMTQGFKNVNLVFPDGVKKGDLSFSGDRIVSYSEPNHPLLEGEQYYVCPGFLDEHIHGARGCDVMDGKISSLQTMADALVEEGVTGFLATTMTESEEKILRSCQSVAEYKKSPHAGAEILGLHLEGPFISEAHKGAQDPAFIKKPDPALLERFRLASEDNIRLITFAYENDEDSSFLSY